MEVDRLELIEALQQVYPAVKKSDVDEVVTTFTFIDNWVVTYNGAILIAHPLELGVGGCVGANELLSVLRKLKSKKCKIHTTDSELLIEAGKTKIGLTLQQLDIPVDHWQKPAEWRPLPTNFVEGLKLAIPSCARDMSRPTLACVCFSQYQLHACDGMRITQIDFDLPLPHDGHFLVPATSLRNLVKYPLLRIDTTVDGWVRFLCGNGTVFCCSTFSSTYPDLTEALEIGRHAKKITLPKRIVDVLSKSMVFAQDEISAEESVTIILRGKRLTAKARNDRGWVEDTIPIKYTGEKLTFSAMPSLLLDIFKKTAVCVVGDEKLLFSGDDWAHIIALDTMD